MPAVLDYEYVFIDIECVENVNVVFGNAQDERYLFSRLG